MSKAPQTLIDLRVFMAEEAQVPKRNFGIAGVITARRPWGFHLSPEEIYGPKGMGDKDYSVRHRRNRGKTGRYSSGFDIKLPVGLLKRLAAYLVEKAKTGEDDGLLFEVIGPDANGDAKRWAVDTGWKPKPARKDHEWHIHLSFWRDTLLTDKRPLFFEFFGSSEVPEPETPELRKGSTGPAVERLQDRLEIHGHPVNTDDGGYGVFGPKTETAVKAFQHDAGLVVDAVVGPITWAALLLDPVMEPEPGQPAPPDNPEQPEIEDCEVALTDAREFIKRLEVQIAEYGR